MVLTLLSGLSKVMTAIPEGVIVGFWKKWYFRDGVGGGMAGVSVLTAAVEAADVERGEILRGWMACRRMSFFAAVFVVVVVVVDVIVGKEEVK